MIAFVLSVDQTSKCDMVPGRKQNAGQQHAGKHRAKVKHSGCIGEEQTMRCINFVALWHLALGALIKVHLFCNCSAKMGRLAHRSGAEGMPGEEP